MIVPVIKQIIVQGEPEIQDDFVLPVIVYIGVEDNIGVNYFYGRVITPKRIVRLLEEDKLIHGRGIFVINKLDLSLIHNEIDQLLQDCIRRTWDEVAIAINRYLQWEYDNIQYETLDEALKRISDDNND